MYTRMNLLNTSTRARIREVSYFIALKSTLFSVTCNRHLHLVFFTFLLMLYDEEYKYLIYLFIYFKYNEAVLLFCFSLATKRVFACKIAKLSVYEKLTRFPDTTVATF